MFGKTIYNYIYILIKYIEDVFFRPDKLCNLKISFISSSLDRDHSYSSGYSVQMVLPY